MAKKSKSGFVEREYVVNLRREILKVSRYRRTPKAIKALKEFVAKHARIPNRDLSKVKLDKYINEELWFRGIQNPPTKIKIKIKKVNDNYVVSLSQIPKIIEYKINKENKIKEQKEDKKKKEEKSDSSSKKEEKEENKVEEKEKEEAVKEAEIKAADLKAKEQKHLSKMKPEKTPKIQRKALQK